MRFRLEALVVPATIALGAAMAHGALVESWTGTNYSSGNWTDSVGGTVATLTTPGGASAPTALPFGNHYRGVQLNGSYFYVNTATSTTAAPSGLTTFSVAVVYDQNSSAPTASGPNYYSSTGLFGGDIPTANQGDYGLAVNSGQEVAAGVGENVSGGIDALSNSATGAYNLNAVNTIVYTISATGTSFSINGGTPITNTPAAGIGPRVTSTNLFDLGRIENGGNGAPVFPGSIALINVYNDTENAQTLSSTLEAQYVPEPASLGVVALGVLGLLARRRRLV